jgi:Trypsin-co-occurring domain 1
LFLPVETSEGVALVRMVAPAQGGPRDIGRDRTLPKLEKVVPTIRSVAGEMVKAVDGLAVSKATISFGVTFSVHAGQLVAAFVDAGQEFAFEVTLEWEPA